ncbi:MAG: hypothetical protein B0W54_12085 [Cellvibrio sp. 79]|nr:MAG: hypothetical protein B0W54_12085 [Cellvibrio sp. 79]
MGFPQSIAPQSYARVAGVCYLLIILLGVFGQIIVRGSLIVPADAAATVQNITASPMLWRWGIIGDIAMHLLDIPVMAILYLLLSPVNKPVALLALGFNIIQTAVLATNKLVLIIPLIVLGNTQYTSAFSAEQINAQIQLLIDVHNYGFGLGLIFFGLACLCYGYLIFKSGYFPKVIGMLMAIAGLCYLLNSITLILAPALSPFVFPLLGICLIAELAFCLRLLIKGVTLSQWQHQVQKLEC